MIQLRDNPPDINQFFQLFETTGWNENYQATPEELSQMLSHSWMMVSAFDGDHLVGFGRMVSDQVLHAMIYDLIVLPEYQGKGIGGEILARLINTCHEAGIRDIQLFCARGKRAWYEKRGFTARPEDAPGMQYVQRTR